MIEEARLWHVTLTVAGTPVEPRSCGPALERLSRRAPVPAPALRSADRAEVRYWEEADCLGDAASLRLRLWGEHRAAGLPRWEVVGLEVVEQSTVRRGRERSTRWRARPGPPSPFARAAEPPPDRPSLSVTLRSWLWPAAR